MADLDLVGELQAALRAAAAERDALRAERRATRALARAILAALDAEKTPNYEVGHDLAVRAAMAILGKEPIVIDGVPTPLDKLPHNETLHVTVPGVGDLAVVLGDQHPPS